MALTNSYAQLDEFLGMIDADSNKPIDDVYIERLLERCSREFDGDTQRWFYAYTATRTYDQPRGRALSLDAPLLAATRINNGNGEVIAASEYLLYPLNGLHKTEIRLKQTSTVYWQSDSNGHTEGVITVTGSWGYVNRNSTDPESARVISNSKTAVLALALAVYRKRYGVGTDGAATVTGAGVVITPREKSREYWALVSLYQAHL